MPLTIRKWTFQHDAVLSLHLRGMRHKEIAEEVGFTESYVSGIINSDQGQIRIRETLKRIRASLAEDLVQQVRELAPLAIKRVRETLDDVCELGSKAKMHQDNVALKILKDSHFWGEGDKDTESLTAHPELVMAIKDGLRESMKIDREQQLKKLIGKGGRKEVTDGEVIQEADFEVVS